MPLDAADVYFNDFDTAVGATFPEWTSTGYTNTAVTLSGTGIRGSPDGGVTVLIAGIAVPVLYVGPRPEYDGMDQINIALPLALRGSGEVDVVVEVNGAFSNTGRINVL